MEQVDEQKVKDLCEAARTGDLGRIKALLADGAEIWRGDDNGITPLMFAAAQGYTDSVRYLLEEGAPWNALDRLGKCAGDYAMECGHQETYELLLDAGVKAELVLGAALRQNNSKDACDNYLLERVKFSEDRLIDEKNKGIMMSWERPLMEAHAKAVCSRRGSILNIGFGMGIVDTAIQSYVPTCHTIIEAHPDVYSRMIQTGWGKKENVQIIFGRWQDVISQLDQYDGIFFDTYSEHYEDLREFHSYLPKLLKSGGIYSFFNGLCGTNPFFHVVCCQVVALELAHLGLSTQFISLPVKDCFDANTWEGISHKYWQLDTYFLPVCQIPEEEDQ